MILKKLKGVSNFKIKEYKNCSDGKKYEEESEN